MVRLNESLSGSEVDVVVSKLATYGAQSIADANKEVYGWLRNGVPVERIESDGRRSVPLARVIDFNGSNDLLAVRQFTLHGHK